MATIHIHPTATQMHEIVKLQISTGLRAVVRNGQARLVTVDPLPCLANKLKEETRQVAAASKN